MPLTLLENDSGAPAVEVSVPLPSELGKVARLQLRVIFSASVAKDPDDLDSNEDYWVLDEGGNGVAVLDGATESYAARRWARLLGTAWAHRKADWLADAQVAYALAMNGAQLSWAQEAASERGSFATIAAIRAAGDGLAATCVGDTCVMLIDGERLERSHPLTSASQFTSAPLALPSDQGQLDRGRTLLDQVNVTLPVPGPGLEAWLATDAIACWLLVEDDDQRAERVRRVRSLHSEEEFGILVASERQAGRMKVDDSTLVRVRLEGAW